MLNSVLTIGRLGRDAELRTTKNGDPMALFSLAVERQGAKGQDGTPDWIPCILFGSRAKTLAPYLTKGGLIGIAGRLESYKNGEGHTRLQVNVSDVNFLSRPEREQPDAALVLTEADSREAGEL